MLELGTSRHLPLCFATSRTMEPSWGPGGVPPPGSVPSLHVFVPEPPPGKVTRTVALVLLCDTTVMLTRPSGSLKVRPAVRRGSRWVLG